MSLYSKTTVGLVGEQRSSNVSVRISTLSKYVLLLWWLTLSQHVWCPISPGWLFLEDELLVPYQGDPRGIKEYATAS